MEEIRAALRQAGDQAEKARAGEGVELRQAEFHGLAGGGQGEGFGDFAHAVDSPLS